MALRWWAIVPLLIGLSSTYASVWHGKEYFMILKPLFHVALFLFYTASIKKFDFSVLLFLVSTMAAEFLAAADFMKYIVYIMLLFTLYFGTGIYLQYPVLKATKKYKLRSIDILLGLGGTSLLLYIILSVFIVSAAAIEQLTLFSIATVVFTGFIASGFFISGFHRHPKKIFLFIASVCYVIICSASLIYELQFPSVFLLGIVNLFEVIAQLSFIFFLLNRKEMLQKKVWLI